MDDIVAHTEIETDTTPELPRVAQVDFVAAYEAYRASRPAKHAFHVPHVSGSRLALIGTLIVVTVCVVTGAYFLARATVKKPTAQNPTATPIQTKRPSPSVKPTARPTSQPTKSPTAPAPAPQPGQRTYTVKAGDTLITIGEQLGKDWRAIAAANGNIQDPNLIYPGQVLIIP